MRVKAVAREGTPRPADELHTKSSDFRIGSAIENGDAPCIHPPGRSGREGRRSDLLVGMDQGFFQFAVGLEDAGTIELRDATFLTRIDNHRVGIVRSMLV